MHFHERLARYQALPKFSTDTKKAAALRKEARTSRFQQCRARAAEPCMSDWLRVLNSAAEETVLEQTFEQVLLHTQTIPLAALPEFTRVALSLASSTSSRLQDSVQSFLQSIAAGLSRGSLEELVLGLKQGRIDNLFVLCVVTSNRNDLRNDLVQAGSLEWLQTLDQEFSCLQVVQCAAWLGLNCSHECRHFSADRVDGLFELVLNLFGYEDESTDLDCLGVLLNLSQHFPDLLLASSCMRHLARALHSAQPAYLCLAVQILRFACQFSCERALAALPGVGPVLQALDSACLGVRHEAMRVLRLVAVHAEEHLIDRAVLERFVLDGSVKTEALQILQVLSGKQPVGLIREGILELLARRLQAASEAPEVTELLTSVYKLVAGALAQGCSAATLYERAASAGLLQQVTSQLNCSRQLALACLGLLSN